MSMDGYTRAWLLAAQRAVKTNNKGAAEFAIQKALDGPCRDSVSCNPLRESARVEPHYGDRTAHIGHNSAFTGGDKE